MSDRPAAVFGYRGAERGLSGGSWRLLDVRKWIFTLPSEFKRQGRFKHKIRGYNNCSHVDKQYFNVVTQFLK